MFHFLYNIKHYDNCLASFLLLACGGHLINKIEEGLYHEVLANREDVSSEIYTCFLNHLSKKLCRTDIHAREGNRMKQVYLLLVTTGQLEAVET